MSSLFRSGPARQASWGVTVLLAAVATGCVRNPAPAAPPAPVQAPAPAAGVDVPVPAEHARAVERGTRGDRGAPGPRYWQQGVSYRIHAELDPDAQLLRGREWITYRNRSPDTLHTVVLNLYQNVFTEGVPRNRQVVPTGGVRLERVAAQGVELPQRSARQIPVRATPAADAPVGYAVEGTLARLRLARPLGPGDSVALEVTWRHRVPPMPSFRTGWEDAHGARAFHVAQWYPQVATYDDLRGWDATPYLGDGEFYTEYGDFDVSVTVPTGHLVGATGVLANPEQVLTPEARRRLAAALRTDTVVAVVSQADRRAGRATLPGTEGRLTWRFRAEGVRDFGFATSDGYVWDASRAMVAAPDHGSRAVAVHALYRPGAPHWERAARFGEHATEFFSRELIPYLYPQITIAEGPIGGMEYPMLVFIGKPRAVESLYGVIAHEIGHQWFPMMVGQDEAAFAWMDEGTATFYENRAAADFFGQTEEASFAGDLGRYLDVAGTRREVPLMLHTDSAGPNRARTVAAYSKPGVLLRSLREVLGQEVFERAMRTYAQEWLLKHPAPTDFFRTMERVSGRQLGWFFYPWWFGTGTLDHAIAAVEGAGTGTAVVRVRDLGTAPAPTLLVGRTASGREVSARIPAEVWVGGAREATATLRAGEPIVEVTIDPRRVFPDAQPDNNRWSAP